MCVPHEQGGFSWVLGQEFNTKQKVSWHWLHGQHWPDSHGWRAPGEKWGLHPAAKQMGGLPVHHNAGRAGAQLLPSIAPPPFP